MSFGMIMIAFAAVWVGLAVLGLVLSVKFSLGRKSTPDNGDPRPNKWARDAMDFSRFHHNPAYSSLPGNAWHRIGD